MTQTNVSDSARLSDSLKVSGDLLPKKTKRPQDSDFQTEMNQAALLFQTISKASADPQPTTQVGSDPLKLGSEGPSLMVSLAQKNGLEEVPFLKEDFQGNDEINSINLINPQDDHSKDDHLEVRQGVQLKSHPGTIKSQLLEKSMQVPSIEGPRGLDQPSKSAQKISAQKQAGDGIAEKLEKTAAVKLNQIGLVPHIEADVREPVELQGESKLSQQGVAEDPFTLETFIFSPSSAEWTPNKVNPLGHQFSGGDFLSTLNLVQGDKPQPVPRNESERPEKGFDDPTSLGFEPVLAEDAKTVLASKKVKTLDSGDVTSDSPDLKAQNKGRPSRAIEGSQIIDPLYSQPSSEALGQALGQAFGQIGSSTLSGTHLPAQTVGEVSAQVVPGAMSRERLSTDALIGVRSEIRRASLEGGGEIRVRLKPEHLGELNVRVITDGARVSLQIQASDEKAKRIIEESMSYLKEGLSSQHLTLGQVELSVRQPSSELQSSLDSQGFQNNSAFHDSLGQNAQQRQQQSSQWNRSDPEVGARFGLGKLSAGVLSSSKPGQTGTTRLDVRA